jgi:hypothetical protein
VERPTRALLSLDGGLGYDYGAPLYKELTDDRVSACFLHVTGTAANAFPVPKELDFELVDDGFLAEVVGFNHSNFFYEAPIEDAMERPQTALLELIRRFFDHTFGASGGDFLVSANAIDAEILAVRALRNR